MQCGVGEQGLWQSGCRLRKSRVWTHASLRVFCVLQQARGAPSQCRRQRVAHASVILASFGSPANGCAHVGHRACTGLLSPQLPFGLLGQNEDPDELQMLVENFLYQMRIIAEVDLMPFPRSACSADPLLVPHAGEVRDSERSRFEGCWKQSCSCLRLEAQQIDRAFHCHQWLSSPTASHLFANLLSTSSKYVSRPSSKPPLQRSDASIGRHCEHMSKVPGCPEVAHRVLLVACSVRVRPLSQAAMIRWAGE